MVKKKLQITICSLIFFINISAQVQPKRKVITDAFLEGRDQYINSGLSASEFNKFNLSKIKLTKDELKKGQEYAETLRIEKEKQEALQKMAETLAEEAKQKALQQKVEEKKFQEKKLKIAKQQHDDFILFISIIVSLMFFLIFGYLFFKNKNN